MYIKPKDMAIGLDLSFNFYLKTIGCLCNEHRYFANAHLSVTCIYLRLFSHLKKYVFASQFIFKEMPIILT